MKLRIPWKTTCQPFFVCWSLVSDDYKPILKIGGLVRKILIELNDETKDRFSSRRDWSTVFGVTRKNSVSAEVGEVDAISIQGVVFFPNLFHETSVNVCVCVSQNCLSLTSGTMQTRIQAEETWHYHHWNLHCEQ